ncbi:MAG: MSHA biogenesis protein MshI [Pseudomonadota bacterium]
MQQINLYLPEFRPSRDSMRAVHMVWGLLAIFILLLMVSAYTIYQHSLLREPLAKAQQEQQKLHAQLQNMATQKPTQSAADLDINIQQLQHELQRRKQILAMISSQNLGNDKGFSAQLSTLAQASLNTISLETFSLQNGGTYAELSGKASSADQIPLYLQKLRADPSFAQVGFGVMNVTRSEPENGLLQFSLAKSPGDNGKKSMTATRSTAGEQR